MLNNIPGWIQASIICLGLIAAVVGFGIHLQDNEEHNRQSIQALHDEVDKLHDEVQVVDDIVRDNQQRLAHIEAILESRPAAKVSHAAE